MASVDERIVEMTFKGSTFVASVKASVDALLQLKNGLNNLKGSESDINRLDDAGKRFSLSHISSGLDAIVGKFKTLGIIGVTALATLASKAVTVGLQILKSLTIDPIKAGLDVYETKINAIQTILANTSKAGTTLKQVTDALNQLNIYANKTVYNFGQMAKNIGTFTAAGVGLKTSVESIKGIANLAALSGSSAEQASTAMYQLSQAIAAGKVKLQDWNSVVNAGIGGKVFQEALIQTAKVHGVAIDAMIKKDQGFRNTLQEGWLTSKILTDTLKTFTGDLSASQLKAMGYTDAETKAIMKQAQAAVDSATKIRTITQLQQALREEIATAWAGVWEALIGDINGATSILSRAHTTLENAFTGPINHLAELLRGWAQLGGREDLIKGITNAFHALATIMHTIGDAFHEVFPPATARSLVAITHAFLEFTQHLQLSKQALADLKTTFVGIFSAIKIVFDVIKGFIHVLATLFGVAASGGEGFLSLTAKIGAFVTHIKDAIERGGALTRFFQILANVLSLPIKAIVAIIGAFGGFSNVLNRVIQAISPFVDKVRELFSHLAQAIVSGIQSGNFGEVASILNKLLLGGVLVSIRKFINNLGKGSKGGGLFSTIRESFEALTGTLRTMQASLKAGILQKIAIAVALLAASLLVLSLINIKDLTKALAAITLMFVQLLGAMVIVTKIGGGAGIIQMEAIGVALNLLAGALLILAGAVAILGHLSWSQITRGLAAIGALLIELAAATAIMSKNAPGVIISAYAMEVMGVALNILSLAVIRLGKQNLGTLAKGIGSIAALLVLLAAFNAFGGEALIGTAAALTLVGAALLIITQAVTQLGSLSIESLAKGLGAVAVSLAIIGVAMAAMSASLTGSAAFVIFAAGLVIMSQALESLGKMSWEAIAKSLVILAGALAILALAMLAMTEGLPGAAALLVMSAALAVLTPVLIALGQMSWESIVKGLVALAGVFVILAAAGILLTPLIPTLLGLGLAVTLVGLGIGAAGAGVLLFATGLTALAIAVTASGAALLSFVTSIVGIIPSIFKQLGLGLVALATALGTGAVAIEKALVAIFTAILDGIIKVAPKAAQAFGAVMTAILNSVNKYSSPILTTFINLTVKILNRLADATPRFVAAGTRLMVNLLNGIANNIQRVATAGTNAAVAFINAVGNSSQRIVTAGVNMVINLINGIANRIRASSPAIRSAAANLGSAIIQGIVAGISGGIGSVISAAQGMASSALHAALSFLHSNSPSKIFRDQVGASIAEGTALGIVNQIPLVTEATNKMGQAALDAIGDSLANADIIGSMIDLQPKITPVLDLTQVKAGASELSSLTKDQLIAATSTTAATSISAANAAAAAQAGLGVTQENNLTFNQYNTSPTALSTVDIYRKTNNQLSRVKGALAGANSG